MLNFVSAPKNLKEVFLRSSEEKSLTEKSVSVDLVGTQIEPVLYLKIQEHLEITKHLYCNKILFKTKLVYVTTCISDKKLNKQLIII